MSNVEQAIDVFLSYAREDLARVEPIVQALKAESFNVYWDRSLEYGANWLNEINAHLAAAPVIVAIWSPHSVKSSFVQAEALKGYERGILVPATLDDAEPPAPFGLVQSAFLGDGPDLQSESWRNFIVRIRALVEKAKAEGAPMTASMLTDTVRSARQAAQIQIADIIKPIREAAADSKVGQSSAVEAIDQLMARLSRDDMFNIAVVGRMKGGKSTLLNALLGPAEGGQVEPLPAETDPCTATIIRLRYSDTPYCRPFSWDKQTDRPGPALPDWTFEEFHKNARIYQNGHETNIFDDIAEFEVGWPSSLLRAGVTLMDTPGISEKPERTRLTRAALVGVDAAIVVYRSEPFAGTDELEFAEEVTARTGKVFTLVNLRGDHTMPPSSALQNMARSRIGVPLHGELTDHDVFFAHFKDGLKASTKNDGSLSERSGLAPFQSRLAAFLLSERYVTHLLKSVREIFPIARTLENSISGLAAGASADVAELLSALKTSQEDLETIKRRRTNIDQVLEQTRRSAKEAALISFKSKVNEIANNMPARLEAVSLGLDKLGDKTVAGTIGNKKWVERTYKKIEFLMQSELEAWGASSAEKPGLANALKPTIDILEGALTREAHEIALTLEKMHERISKLDTSSSSQGSIVSDGETIASLVVGAIVLGPLGIAGVGGWRGVAGAVGGFVGGGFVAGLVTTLLGLAAGPAGWVALGTALLASLGGTIFGSTAGVEKRLKKTAWKELEPNWRNLAIKDEALGKVANAVDLWFDSIRADIAEGLGRLVAAEEQSLNRLAELAREQESKEQLIADLQKKLSDVRSGIARAEAFEQELSNTSGQFGVASS